MLTEAGNLDFDLGNDSSPASSGDSGGGAPDAGGGAAAALPTTPYNQMFTFNDADFKEINEVPLPSEAEAQAAAEATPPAAAAPAAETPAAPATADAQPPAAETAPPASIASPSEIIDPLFAPFETPAAGVLGADKFVKDLHEMDPGRANLLYNAVFDHQKPAMTAWVLEELGLNPALAPALQEKAEAISNWLQNGGELPAQAGEPQFPKPDEFGIATLPDGTELDTSDPIGLRAYNAEKTLFDLKQAEARATAEKTRTDAETSASAIERQAEARVETFGQERASAITKAFTDLKLDYGAGNEWVAPEVSRHARDLCFNDPEIRALNAEGERLAREGGTRLSVVAQQLDGKIAAHIATAVERYNGLMLNANRAERAARSMDPVLPSGTQKIAAGAAAATNSPQNQGRPLSMDGAIRNIASEIEAGLA